MRSSIRILLLVLTAAATLGACGGAVDDAGQVDDVPDADGSPSLGAPADGGLSVPEALQTDVSGPITVQGFLIDEGNGPRLCAAALESYPPQCGGESLEVEGVEVASLDTATTEGAVSWADQAILTGELENGTLIVSDTVQA